MLGFGALSRGLGLLFGVVSAFDFAFASAAAAAARSLSLAVVLRVLYLLLGFATLQFVVVLLVVVVGVAVSVLVVVVVAVLALAVDPRLSLGVKVALAASTKLSSAFEQAARSPVLGVISWLAISLSLLLLNTAAAASSHVGMRIAAILRISLRASPGVFFIFFG